VLVLAACLLACSSYAQSDQDSGLNDLGINSSLNITELMGLYLYLEGPEYVYLEESDISLQELIDNADNGATVTVPPAIYALSRPICIRKNITLVGSPFAYIDGQEATRILNIDDPKANVAVENLLFTHSQGDDGGAINSQAESLTIKNCCFLDNIAFHGAGVYQKGGNLKVINSTFEDNKVIDWGIAVYDEGGNVQLENSTFDHNFGSSIIYIIGDKRGESNVLIKGCSVSNNERWIGIDCEASDVLICLNTTALIDHCVFNNNSLAEDESKICASGMVLGFGNSKAVLNDTQIERNEGIFMTALRIYGIAGDSSGGSIVQMNRCNISENHAISLVFGGEEFSEVAGVDIDQVSEVSMTDVIIKGNTADYGEAGAIRNAGKLNLNKGTVITKNSARRYSALLNTKTGVVNINKDAYIGDNYDKLQLGETIHNDGILNQYV
jgi:hypothetical protein